MGGFSSPTLGDLDGDGDLDLVAGERFGTFFYYENTGTATSPAFLPQTGATNPLNGQSAVSYSNPALGDLDGDGDLDLVSGGNGLFYYFENTGSATSPVFTARTGAANPLYGQSIGGGTPALGDFDGDGDLDLVTGNNDGTLITFENTGSATSPDFVRLLGIANPLAGHDVGATSAPALGDLDNDGDPDLVSGEFDGVFSFFEHFGGRLAKSTGAANPLDGFDVSYLSSPTFGDLDADGDLDVVSGASNGDFLYYENTGSAASPAFVERVGAANPLAGQGAGLGYTTPALGDWDDDGDLDLLSGDQAGVVHLFRNSGTAASPAFFKVNVVFGFNPPIDETAPALGDVDGDGDLDFVVGESGGSLKYFENVNGFIQRFGAANPFGDLEIIVAGRSAPALGDLDGDGDVDLVSGDDNGRFAYFENTGSTGNPAFIRRDENADPPVSPVAGQDVGERSKPALGDLDGDGDLDLVAGERFGAFHYVESFVAQASPAVLEPTGGANPLDGEDVGSLAAPALADLDGDGDADLVTGDEPRSVPFPREHRQRDRSRVHSAHRHREPARRPRHRRRCEARVGRSRWRRRLRPACGESVGRLGVLREYRQRDDPAVRGGHCEPVRPDHGGQRQHRAGLRRPRRRRRPRPRRGRVLRRAPVLREHRQPDEPCVRKRRSEPLRRARNVLLRDSRAR